MSRCLEFPVTRRTWCVCLLLALSAAAASLTVLTSNTNANLKIDFLSSDPQIGYAVGRAGVIIQTVDGGTNWSPSSSGVTLSLFDVVVINALTAIAVGDDGIILRTQNGGVNWADLSFGTRELYGVSFPSETVGFAVGFRGTLIRTADQGSTWTQQIVPSPVSNNEILWSVSFTSVQVGYAVGADGYFLSTTDGGAVWALQQIASSAATGSGYAHLKGVDFSSEQIGFVCGKDGTVMHTTDAGATWNSQMAGTGDLASIHVGSTGVGFVVGADASPSGPDMKRSGQIWTTANWGFTWTSLAPPEADVQLLRVSSLGNVQEGMISGEDGAIYKISLDTLAPTATPTGSPTPLSRSPIEVSLGGCAYNHYPNTGCGSLYSTKLSNLYTSTPELCGAECSNVGDACVGYRWCIDCPIKKCQLRSSVSITTALTAPADALKACYVKLVGEPADGRCLTFSPTQSPTNTPTTGSPTNTPTNAPSTAPSNTPTTAGPTNAGDTYAPTNAPSNAPSNSPSDTPTSAPSNAPSIQPTNAPSSAPTNVPTSVPTTAITNAPTRAPTNTPTRNAADICVGAINTSAIDQIRVSYGHSPSQVASNSAWEAACWNEGCFNPATEVTSCKSNCGCTSSNGCSGGSCCNVCRKSCRLGCEQYYLLTTGSIATTDSDSTLSSLTANAKFSEDSNSIFDSESSTLAISNGVIVFAVEPAFAPFPFTKYSISIPAEISSIGISAVCSDPLATIVCTPGNDSPAFNLVSSSQPIAVAGARRAEMQQISLVVTSPDSTSSTTYTIDIVRSATAGESGTSNLLLYLLLGFAALLILMMLILCGCIYFRRMSSSTASDTSESSQKSVVHADTDFSKSCSSPDLIQPQTPKDLLEVALRSFGDSSLTATTPGGTDAGTEDHMEEHMDRVDSALLRDECTVDLEAAQPQHQPDATPNGDFFSFSDQVQHKGAAEEAATATQAGAGEAALAKAREDALVAGKAAARADKAAALAAQHAEQHDEALEMIIERHNAQHHSQTHGSQGGTHAGQAKRSRRSRSGLNAGDDILNSVHNAGPVTEEELAQIHRQFQQVDYNNDGALTVDEFSHIGNIDQFNQLDRNGDGVITEQEMMDRFFPFENDEKPPE